MRRLTIFFFIVYCFCSVSLQALYRDYYDDVHFPRCPEHLSPAQFKENDITLELANYLPRAKFKCVRSVDEIGRFVYCPNNAIYYAYVDFSFSKYRSHLKRQLQYCQSNPSCNCFWPECTSEAAQISDIAYLLFRDLILTTALSDLEDDVDEQYKFVQTSGREYLNIHGLTIAFIVKQLHFSDYYNVCRDIESYAYSRYEEGDAAEIKEKLEDALEVLYSKFYTLYKTCIAKHPSKRISQELEFMELLSGQNPVARGFNPFTKRSMDSHELTESIIANLLTVNSPIQRNIKTLDWGNSPESHKTPKNIKAHSPDFDIESDIFLEQGTLFNSLSLYDEAIRYLNLAIQISPSSRDAYIERAYAFFEKNELDLALKDYEQARKLSIIPGMKPEAVFGKRFYVPQNKMQFAEGVITGVLKGAGVSLSEFIPSIFSCCRGILNGLWAFTCSPVEVSGDLINAAYAIGEYIDSHSTLECLEYVVPELKELSLTWHTLDDNAKGEKIGYIIGKYGVDIFAPVGALKGIKKLRTLKRANTMATLESCVASHIKKEKILQESTKFASARAAYCELAKKGKILTKNSNAQVHIMQKKHAWDKLVKLSGVVEEDFAKVATLLEEHDLFNKAYASREPLLFPQNNPRISKTVYKKTINGYEVRAEFETYLDSGITFLQDAWVVKE